jgi:transcription elongation factor SPT6
VFEEDYEDDMPKKKELTLQDVYEPSEIKDKMLTDKDELIRIRDVPERIQATDAYLPDDQEVSREANILTKTFLRDKVDTNEKSLSTAIACVLRFLRRDHLEVPFIYRHRRDYFDGILNMQDLWRIVDLDEKFIAVELKKKTLGQLILEISAVDSTIETDPQIHALIEKIVTLDDIKDTFAYIHLLYSTHIGMLQTTQAHRRIFKRSQWKILYDDSIVAGLKKFAEVY